mgnify:CR=1 FL=1
MSDQLGLGLNLEIRRATTLAEVEAGMVAFDGPVKSAAAAKFLREPTHHLMVAYVGDQPAGMITGVEMTHPDKGTEMFLYELGVAEAFRGRGVGKRLVLALVGIAREAGCYGMWVLTERDNQAALATYQSAGAVGENRYPLLSWDF